MTETTKKDILLLLSGGRDSFLSACILIEQGHHVHMVTYDNGCGVCIENAEQAANRLIKLYGADSASYLGIYPTMGIWREFLLPIYNFQPKEISEKFGEITISQLNCLTCRTAMYVYSILICKSYGYKYLAEGARRDQGFAVEQEDIISRYRSLLLSHDIELILPVYEMTNNWERKNLLLARGLLSKTFEPQCLLGAPLDRYPLPDEVLAGSIKYFDSFLAEKITQILQRNENMIIQTSNEF